MFILILFLFGCKFWIWDTLYHLELSGVVYTFCKERSRQTLSGYFFFPQRPQIRVIQFSNSSILLWVSLHQTESFPYDGWTDTQHSSLLYNFILIFCLNRKNRTFNEKIKWTVSIPLQPIL